MHSEPTRQTREFTLIELRGITYNRWRGSVSQIVRYHPNKGINVMTLDGSGKSASIATSGSWADNDLKFYE